MKTVYHKSTKRRFTFKLNFITLTLSATQTHSDSEIKKKLLEPFIKYMKRNHSMNSYVWKAEVQDNGNIHFHITTNVFIHHMTLRNAWNGYQKNLGYLQKYETTHKHDSPNSTDIHSVRNIKNVGGYIASYVNKKDKFKKNINTVMSNEHFYKDKERPTIECYETGEVRSYKRIIEGQLWNCSLNLKQKPKAITTHSQFDSQELQQLYFNHKGKIDLDFATLYIISESTQEQTPRQIKQILQQHKETISKSELQQKFFTVD